MNLYDYENIRHVQVELTANCNAMCPGCDRFIDTKTADKQNLEAGELNPTIKPFQGRRGHMEFRAFKNLFTPNFTPRLDVVEYNGTWGDFMLHPDVFKFTEYLTTVKGPTTGWEVATNGGLHDEAWWQEVARYQHEFYRPNSRVIFGIDGVDDESHQMYRRGVNFDKLIRNAKAFIDAGGRAAWQWIEFDHNAHLTDQAMDMAVDLGFEQFLARSNRASRLVAQKVVSNLENNGSEVNRVVIKTPTSEKQKKRLKYKNNVDGTLVYGIDNQIMSENVEKKVSKYSSESEYRDKTCITCRWGSARKINVEFNGLVHPCCHLNHYMSGWRDQWVSTALHGKEYEVLTSKYEDEFNNLYHHKIDEILSHDFYKKDLYDSWKNTTKNLNNPKLNACIDNCGEATSDIQVFEVHKL
jgi:MoaA/NifB/PqqE/SkfB family radical SAM enzyme